MELLLGIDIGTTGCKAAFYDKHGNSISCGYGDYGIISPHDGWAEEDPEEWWRKTVEAVNECLQKCSVNKKDVLAICVSSTNGLVPIGKDGELCHRAIMQVDKRSQSQLESIDKKISAQQFIEKTGNSVKTGGYSASTMLWLKEHMPWVYKDAYKFLSPAGFIVHRLTGEFTLDYTRASTAALMDIYKLRWHSEICDELNIDKSKLPDLFPSECQAGRLSNSAARELSLPDGVPVCVGIMDSSAAVIGSGCSTDHKVSLIIGTVSRLCVAMNEPIFEKEFLNSYLNAETPYLVMAPTNGGGSSLKWFVDSFGEHEKTICETLKLDPYDFFDIKALEVPPGSNGLLYLPYIYGERSPIWDANAKGVFFGITPKHTKAHFTRAIMEGVAHSALHNLLLMEDCFDSSFKVVTISGGGAKSLLWCEIMSNMFGKTLIRSEEAETETRGAAFAAGIMSGIYGSYKETEKFSISKNIIRPNIEISKTYSLLNNLYQSLYIHLRDDFASLAEIMEKAKFLGF